MKTIFFKIALILSFCLPSLALAEQVKGLNVIVNSADAQTQAMAMTLSLMSVKKHHKQVRIVLCGPAGDLADKNIKGTPIKRPNGKAPSAKKHLKMLIQLGATVEVCPLYLPNSAKDKTVLLEGIKVANPVVVSGWLLDKDYKNLSF